MMKLEELKEFLGSDEKFIARLVDKFLQESTLDMDKLKAAAAATHWEMCRAVAHKMLSSTRIFNMSGLNTSLEAIEMQAPSELQGLVNEAEQSWKKEVAELRAIRSAIPV